MTTLTQGELSTELTQDILTCLPCGLVVLNAQGIVVWFNEEAANLLGPNLLGCSWLMVLQEAFAPRADDGYEVSLADGRRVKVAISALERLPGELVILNDMTATRQYEQSRAHQGRLAVIGRMTAQLAHQIRTPLSSAMLFAEHLNGLNLAELRVQQWLARIQDCHESIEKQIHDLLLFAKGAGVEREEVNWQDWIGQLRERIAAILVPTKVKWTLYPHLSSAIGSIYRESLTGAILNLINNAVQAEASALTVTIAIDETSLSVNVVDNGEGMTEEVKNQAFAPFFTTKAQGTGLGLAVVEAVVLAHHGHIEIDSALGQGCSIKLHLLHSR